MHYGQYLPLSFYKFVGKEMIEWDVCYISSAVYDISNTAVFFLRSWNPSMGTAAVLMLARCLLLSLFLEATWWELKLKQREKKGPITWLIWVTPWANSAHYISQRSSTTLFSSFGSTEYITSRCSAPPESCVLLSFSWNQKQWHVFWSNRTRCFALLLPTTRLAISVTPQVSRGQKLSTQCLLRTSTGTTLRKMSLIYCSESCFPWHSNPGLSQSTGRYLGRTALVLTSTITLTRYSACFLHPLNFLSNASIRLQWFVSLPEDEMPFCSTRMHIAILTLYLGQYEHSIISEDNLVVI